MVGRFIVLDGTDGSGKGTQTKLLVDRLKSENHQVEMADFPQYTEWSAIFVEKYLNGTFGALDTMGAKKSSLFYALDRYAASFKIRQWLVEDKIVISNRYVSANKGHQLGKLHTDEQRHEFLGWVNETEYGILELPVPDLTLFLHMSASIGQQLVDQKATREYTDKKRDLHEADINHLTSAEQAYLFCVEHDQRENWQRVVCFEQNQPKTIDIIHQEIYQKVKKLLE